MLMDMVVKVPQSEILKATNELKSIPCLRKEVEFELTGEKWRTRFSCGGYGNGYGVGFVCSENCSLRITDISKCHEIDNNGFKYLVQKEKQIE